MSNSLWLRRVIILAACGVIVGLAASLAVRFARANDDIEAKLANLERPAVAPEQNAAQWLKAGAAAVVWSKADSEAIGSASLSPSTEWSPELEAAVRVAVDRQAGALATLHRAASVEQSSYGIDYTRGLGAEMPDLLSLIKACRLLIAETRLADTDGDEDAAVIALATAGKMATTLERESSILTALIGIACERMMLLAAAETLASGHPWTGQPAFLDALEATLPTEDLADTMHRAFDAWALSNIKALAEEPERAEGWEPGVTAADFARVAASLNRLVETPYGTAPDRFAEGDPDAPLAELMVETKMAIPRHQAALAQRQLVRAAIALRRIGITDGAYPADRSLVAELTEPDPFTGRPLAYDVRQDGSAEVRLARADEQLEQVVLKSAAHVPPIELPTP
jgi:hypothetical protein